ncbi:MAG: hypothetical protein FWC43_08225 [Planctomycetaceae bacterium]|nr:hypothetical protein [Planctomycetaceae bacterium]
MYSLFFRLRLSVFLLTVAVFIGPVFSEETLEYPVDTGQYLGPSDLVVDPSGELLYVAEFDAARLRQVRTDGSAPAQVLELPIKPERIKLLQAGKSLVAVGGERDGKLLLIDCESLTIVKEIPVGYYPFAVDVYEPSGIAYVANRFGGDVSVVDLDAGREIRRLPFGREPIALAVTPDGKKLIVVPQNPEDQAVESGITLTVRIYDTESGEVKKLRLHNGIVNGRDVVITPDGRYAFLTCILGHFENVPTHVDGGWMVENMVAAIDMEVNQYADTFYLDDFGRGAGNPWGIRCSSDMQFLAVAHSGSCEITLLNLPKIFQILDARPHSSRPGFGAMTTTFYRTGDNSLPTRMRIPVGVYGVRQLTLHENRIYFTAYYEDSIGRIDCCFTEPIEQVRGFMLDPKTVEQPVRLDEPLVFADTPDLPLLFEEMTPLDLMKGIRFERRIARLGPKPVLTDIRFGNQLFHDATICYEQWQSCVTCHPDGRADCLNWDLLNDGIGNPKNTKSMVLSHETPPAMISGVRKDAETAVRSGIKSILFAVRPEKEAEAMDAYLKSLQPVPSPYLVDGQLSESAKRGKALFNSASTGCSDCHPAPLFTDLQMHDVGTRNYRDTQSDFDTPTLVEIWRTSPYLHDGRYITMKELIVEGKHVDKDGRFSKLSEQEIDDLVEYVLSL